jgi:uncharacterized membrane protein
LNRWAAVFGDGSFYLRFFSLIWGVLTVFLIYRLARLLLDRPSGLISAFLLSISVFHIFHCQQIRHFALIVFLATASVYMFFKYSRSGRVRDVLILLGVNVLLINTYPTGFYVVLAEAFFALLYSRERSWRNFFFSQLVLVACIVRLGWSVDRQHITEFIWWIPKPGMSSLIETFNTLAWGGERYGLDDLRVIFPATWPLWVLSLVYVPLFLRGFVLSLPDRRMGLVALWCAGPVLLTFLFSLLSEGSFYSIKHLIIVLPAFYILVARGMDGFKKWQKVAVLAVVLVLNVVPLSAMYARYYLPDWRAGVAFLKENIWPGDTVVVASLSEVVPFMYYFDRGRRSLENMDIYGRITADNYQNSIFVSGRDNLIVGLKQSRFGDRSISAHMDLENKTPYLVERRSRRVWVLLSRWVEADPGFRDEIMGKLRIYYREAGCRHFQGVDVCRFDPVPTGER